MNRIDAANYAPLVMYAWDMCDLGPRSPAVHVDARIAARGWTVVGYLSGDDDTYAAGDSIRSTVMGQGDRVWYGYVATNAAGQAVVAVRGTDGAEEWGDDLDFYMIDYSTPGGGALVDRGFFNIYASMWFHPTNNLAAGGPAIAGIKNALAGKSVMVLGHSLGAAIATYVTLDLNRNGCPASACLFASPKTGNRKFVDFFEATVSNYDVFNYERDLVPMVPVADILHLSKYETLRQAKSIPAAGAGATVCDNPACNHHLICYTALLDVATYKREMANPNLTDGDRECAACVSVP
jgi:hypothetical protein